MTNQDTKREIPGLDADSIKLLMDKSTNGILVLRDNTILYVNQALADLFETEKQELLGKRITDVSKSLLHNAAPAVLERYFMLLNGDATHDEDEYEFVDSRGRVRKISVSTDVTKLGEDSMVSLLIRDLTEQTAIEAAEKRVHQAEKRAQESMNSIKSILDRAEDFFFVLDNEGKILAFNEFFQQRIGYTPSDLKGMHIAQLHPLENQEEIENLVSGILDEKIDQCTLSLLTAEGKQIPVILRVFEGQWQGENVVYGIARDISEIQVANEALAKSEKLLSSVFSSITDGISILDKDLNIIRVNKTMKKWYMHAAPLVGKKCYEAYHLSDSPCDECPTRVSLEQGVPATEYVPRIGPDGEKTGMIELHSFPLFDQSSNELTGVIEYVRDISDQRRAEELLRESESRFRSLFEDSPISLWEEDFSRVKAYFDELRDSGITDFRTHFDEHPDELRKCIHLVKLLNVNEATLELHGVESQQELVKGVDSIISEGAIDVFKEELLALVDGATHFRGESEFQLASGEFRDLLLDVTIPPGHEDTWDRLYVAMLDITERNRAKMMLHREREAYRLVADAAVHSENAADLCSRVLSGLIKTLDFDLGVMRLLVPEENKLQLIALEGINRDLVEQEIDLESVEGSDMLIARTAKTKRPILVGDVEASDETQIQIKRIHELGIKSLIIWPILDATKNVLGVFSIAAKEKREFVDLDRTLFDTIADLLATVLERQKTEEQLRTTEEHFQLVAETVRDGLVIRRDDRVVLINDRACEILGYPREELMNKTTMDLAIPAEQERLERAFNEMRTCEPELTELEFWIEKKDGKRAFVKNRYTIMMNEDGSASHYIIITDATERKLAEEEVRAARARAEFFNDLMAHDLNNVHQGIMISLELLLLNPDLPPHLKNKLQAALDQVNRSLELIANVRKFSAVDVAPFELTKTQISGVVERARQAIINAFPNREVTITTDLDEDCCARADDFLVDVFYNLFHNAVKFDESDETKIEVTGSRIPSQDMIEISVADYGPGISDDHKETLFARLLPDRRSGSGIGLTLVKRIIERYGGTVRVEDTVPSEVSSGTRFVLQIPECKR